MPISHELKFCKPAVVNDALKTLAVYGNAARILAGGTDLIVKIKEDIETPLILINIKELEELKKRL